MLGGRSDSVEEILCALGIGLLKRKVMVSYAGITDVQLMGAEPPTEPPTMQITTHLPLKNTKQVTVTFDGTFSDQNVCLSFSPTRHLPRFLHA